jgi:hypothetical protein
MTGLTPQSAAAAETHSHAENNESGLPAGATAGAVMTVDEEGLSVFEDKEVKHAVLVKIHQVAL